MSFKNIHMSVRNQILCSGVFWLYPVECRHAVIRLHIVAYTTYYAQCQFCKFIVIDYTKFVQDVQRGLLWDSSMFTAETVDLLELLAPWNADQFTRRNWFCHRHLKFRLPTVADWPGRYLGAICSMCMLKIRTRSGTRSAGLKYVKTVIGVL